MLPTAHLLAFTLTAFALIVVPGPSVLFTVSRALALGRMAGVATVAGNTVGVYVQVVAVAFGIGALVERSVMVFTIVKLGGAAYLIFLGVQAIRHRQKLAEMLGSRIENKSVARVMADGFVVGIGNPKAIVFFAAVLPQFVDRRPVRFRSRCCCSEPSSPGSRCCPTAAGHSWPGRRGPGSGGRHGGWNSSAGPGAW